jgi:peptidoglycan/LPS O-acetylase OafA/YrhL
MSSIETKDYMKNDTKFLRFIAIVLIINSHLDAYYPIQYFGTGGALGNAFFFVLSSFGLFLSQNKNPKPFAEWYTKRIKRIYPAVWIVLILLTLPYKIYIHDFDLNNLLLFFGYFFYPPFWFLQALMIFYILIYFIIKNNKAIRIYFWLIILPVIYAFFYLNYIDLSKWSIEDDPFQYIFYLIIFIFGAFLAERSDKIKYSGLQDWALLFLSVFIIYGHKYLMLKGMFSSLQFIQHLFIFPFIFYFLKVSRSDLIQKRIMQLPAVASTINYISNVTLELYLAHLYVVIFILKLKLIFPVNIIAVLIVTLIIAAFIKYLSNRIFFSSAHLPHRRLP